MSDSSIYTVLKGLIPVGIIGLLSYFLMNKDKVQTLKDLFYKQKQDNLNEKLQSVQAEKVRVEAEIPNIRKASIETQEAVQTIMNTAAKKANDIVKSDATIGTLGDKLDKEW